MIRKYRLITLTAIIAIYVGMGFAEQVSSGKVTIQYEPMEDGGVRVVNVWNKADKRIDLKIDGKIFTINANSSAQINQYASKYVRYDYAMSAGDLLWRRTAKKEVVAEEPSQTTPQTAVANETPRKIEEDRRGDESGVRSSDNIASRLTKEGYLDRLNQDEFFGTEAVTAYTQQVEKYCRAIDSANDKAQYIVDNDVKKFLDESEREIQEKRVNLASIAQEIVYLSNVDNASQASTLALIVETLNNRLKTREEACMKLNNKVSDINDGEDTEPYTFGKNIWNYIIVGAIVLLVIALVLVAMRNKKKKQNAVVKQATKAPIPKDVSAADSSIVVRRRTTSILKKQSLEDVIGDPAYMVIDSSDFSTDSSIGKIYIKNTCIKEIYNLYEEDLRNTENPKEDGCMVLGRWVLDEANHTYDVSLEEVVLPGDDAVFKEYELNFGGKIKLRIAEKLRKLRRETNLQYDLVCWIHSHPGLGVFFSNSDDNVQMQLRHSQHPHFLIAFVVDILTSNQEMGIFTFRKDGSMNSKGDMIRMYSLEEMYKWALQSERNSFSHENYFNILKNAKIKLPSCKGVELNNNSVIDLTQIILEPETGIIGWVIGTTIEEKDGREFVVSNIVHSPDRPGAGVIGCLINMTHMSFPTIQRLTMRDSANLSFVMVYSSRLMTLTTIPVINGELLPDEQFYGDVNIDDLKIWTRRKR